MKKINFKRPFILLLCMAFVFTLMSAAVSANNRMTTRSGATDSDRTDGNNIVDDIMGNDTYEGNIDSGIDGHIDENSDTGEFADATDSMDDNRQTTENSVESVIDGAADSVSDAVDDVTDTVDDATDTVDDATDGNMWGIVIAIIVIVALAALLFMFFTRKK